MRITQKDRDAILWLRAAFTVLQRTATPTALQDVWNLRHTIDNPTSWQFQEKLFQITDHKVTYARFDRLEKLGLIERKPSGGSGPLVRII